MMKLIGSTTSPFVRRVRLLLDGIDYKFEALKALSPEGGQRLESYGPIKRIPILIDDGKTIFDSTIISEYLLELKGIRISIDDKLKLRLIDELCDSCILLFQQKLWEIDEDWQNELSRRMHKRAILVLAELERSVDELNELQKDWLFCVLDWLCFRSVIDWKKDHKNLVIFHSKAKTLEKYKSTTLSL